MVPSRSLQTVNSKHKRSAAPVFVLGCPRSGTTLLYDMLLSAGGFAVYLAESNVFNVLATRFGDLRSGSNRRKLLRVWGQSQLFRATGLEWTMIERKVLDECRSYGDFLRLVMDEVAKQQEMQRWAENSPESILHLAAIKKAMPDALVIHIIRDGRDVAMSLEKLRYVRPFPWQERQSLFAAGVYWEWIVQKGRTLGKDFGRNYLEIHFEDLVRFPQQTLDTIAAFIEHDLDYEKIRHVAYGSVGRPNTSFSAENASGSFSPVGRWRSGLSPQQLVKLEALIGRALAETGYELSIKDPRTSTLSAAVLKRIYRGYFDGKLRFKQNRLCRTLRPELSASEIDATTLAEDRPPNLQVLLTELGSLNEESRR